MKIISARTHTIIGLVVGVALLAAPWLFGFADLDGPVVMVPMIIGIIVILSELTTTSPASPVKLVPMRVHLMVDMLLGFILAFSPWLFAFADQPANAWVPHLVVGLAMIGYAMATDPHDARVSLAR